MSYNITDDLEIKLGDSTVIERAATTTSNNKGTKFQIGSWVDTSH
jgi:hypothetical protein